MFEWLINMSHSSLCWQGNKRLSIKKRRKNFVIIIFDRAKCLVDSRDHRSYRYADVNVVLGRHDLNADVSGLFWTIED